jgi:hypothetical protein
MARIRELMAVEAPTLLALLGLLVVIEVGFRLGGDRLSGDIAHMEEMSEITRDVYEAPGFRILFVGNSLLGEGVDAGLLGELLGDSLGRDVYVGVIRPDGSSPLEWSYLLDRYVFEMGRTPDLLVVPFGPAHLFDRRGREAVLRLAAHHVSTRDIPNLLDRDLTGFESRAQFFIARLSRAFALRDRLQPRVLDMLIPDYRELAPMILRAKGPQAPTTEGTTSADSERAQGADPVVSGTRLFTLDQVGRIADRSEAAGLPFLLLAMPQGRPWDLDPRVDDFVTGRDPGLLDFRRELNLPAERFPDGQHMDAEGRERFTRMLSVRMLPTVRQIDARPNG